MTFELLPVLETMISFYQQPRTPSRFQAYLKLLQGGTKGELIMPIGGFNPMAKEHVLEKLLELKHLNTEPIMDGILQNLNKEIAVQNNRKLKVALNVCDDLKGAWTNRFTTDYDSKFKLSALVARNFCTPVFWTSENYSTGIIIERVLEYCYRTIYRLQNPSPQTLQDHIAQEAVVAKNTKAETQAGIDFKAMDDFYQLHKTSNDYNLIFNFLYGDGAAFLLGNNALGINNAFAGLEFAKWLAAKLT